jgi:hypothetical protein
MVHRIPHPIPEPHETPVPTPDAIKRAKRKEIRSVFNRKVLTAQGVPQETIEQLMMIYDQGDDPYVTIDSLMQRYTDIAKQAAKEKKPFHTHLANQFKQKKVKHEA